MAYYTILYSKIRNFRKALLLASGKLKISKKIPKNKNHVDQICSCLHHDINITAESGLQSFKQVSDHSFYVSCIFSARYYLRVLQTVNYFGP